MTSLEMRFTNLISGSTRASLLAGILACWALPVVAGPRLSLDDCVRMAVRRNGRLVSTQAVLEAAEQRARETSVLRLPSASLRGAASFAPLTGLDPALTNGGEYQGLLDLKLLLYDGGSIRIEQRQAQVGVQQAASEHATTAADVRLDVRLAYIDLVGTRNRFELTRQSIQDLQSYLETVRSLASGGGVPKTDILKVELQVQEEARALNDLRAGEASASQRLLESVGLPADTTLAVEDTLVLPGVPEVFSDAANRDLASAAIRLKAAELDVRLAAAERRPALSFLGSVGGWTSRQQLDEPGPHHVFGYQAGVGLDVPVWNWGATRARIGQKSAQAAGLRSDYAVLRRHLEAEFRSSAERYRLAKQQLELLEESHTKALEQYDGILARYAGGGASSLEVLDAHRSALAVLLEEAQTRSDLRALQAQMLRQIGEPE